MTSEEDELGHRGSAPESPSAEEAREAVAQPAAGESIDPSGLAAGTESEPGLERTVQILEAKLNLHRGPLPSPEVLHAYEQIQPGTAERVVQRWEKQSDHRMALESQQVEANNKARTRGQYIGMVVAMTVVVGGFIAIYLNKPLAGVAALVLAAATIAGRFIVTSRNISESQLSEPEPE